MFGLQLIEFIAALPLAKSLVQGILSRAVSFEMLEQAQLQSFTGCLLRAHFPLSQIDQIEGYLSDARTDLNRLIFVIRIGPLHLGTCGLAPWYLKTRPLAAALGVESHLQSIRSLSRSTGPL